MYLHAASGMVLLKKVLGIVKTKRSHETELKSVEAFENYSTNSDAARHGVTGLRGHGDARSCGRKRRIVSDHDTTCTTNTSAPECHAMRARKSTDCALGHAETTVWT